MGVIKVAVLVSGSGTTLQALINEQVKGNLEPAVITIVISDKVDAFALQRAQESGIEAVGLSKKELGLKAFEQKLHHLLEQYDIDLVVLGGFLTLLSGEFVSLYPQRIINIHPSLIPSFCGKGFWGERVHKAALERGVKLSGATIHLVNEEPDGGPILAQEALEVLSDDTPHSLGLRIQQNIEWKLLPKVVSQYAKELLKNMSIQSVLKSMSYPGRLIMCGMGEDGHAIVAYALTGRSKSSQNRVFIEDERGVFTKAIDESLVTDPSLIIYRAMAYVDDTLIIANGDQSESIVEGLTKGEDFQSSLQHRTFEPDEPHYTPRISALYTLTKDPSYTISILKRGKEGETERLYYHYNHLTQGEGHLIHTYQGGVDVLQSFSGEPTKVVIPTDVEACASQIWESLADEYKVALVVKEFDAHNRCTKTIMKNRRDR